ncbi:MAG TPA: hypothetical protein VK988_02385 [Acidimicrobiales bacterium]|nr:hypothetical protein [Acidimicrobiales bacterium]
MLVDHERLAELATIEFAPPPELSPAQGGVVLTESVGNERKEPLVPRPWPNCSESWRRRLSPRGLAGGADILQRLEAEVARVRQP